MKGKKREKEKREGKRNDVGRDSGGERERKK